MQSRTKRRMSQEAIADLLREAWRPDADLRGCEEFTDGWFCSVYGLDLADGRRMVLKLAPEPGLTLMRYEFELMHAEIEFYRLATGAGVPMPDVHAADPERGYLLLERLDAPTLAAAGGAMTADGLAAVRRDLGRVVRRLGSVTGPWFGYPRSDGRTRSARWRTSFLAFIDDVLCDAADFGVELPASPARIRDLVTARADSLDEVTTPAVVHADIGGGNVFVDHGDGTAPRVRAIIDGERWFYGDPIVELVALAGLGEPEEVSGLLDGFLGRALTGRERARLRLYKIYLLLIMATEGSSRGFDPAEHEPIRRDVLDRLEAELAAL